MAHFPGLLRLLCLLGSALLGLSHAAPAPRTLLCFGDSLTAGYGLADPSAESYPARLQETLTAAKLDWRVVNAGLSGETSAGGLRRVDWVLRQPADIFLLALGGNDALRGIDPAVTRANLTAIIGRVRAKYPQALIVVAGMQAPPTLGADYAGAFARIFPDVAREQGATLVPFLLEGVGGEPALNQSDQIHPNPEGHRRIAATVWAVTRPLLERATDRP
jgi:acyl-CoA thioesterase-1